MKCKRCVLFMRNVLTVGERAELWGGERTVEQPGVALGVVNSIEFCKLICALGASCLTNRN